MVETRDKKQAVLVIGFPGTTMHSDDRYALDLLQECCSDLGSRLFLRIREQLGLAYYVGAQNFAGLVQDLGHLASTSALDELYGLGWQHGDFDDAKYEAVTLEQAKAAAQKYLKPDSLVVAVVKPETV